MLIFRLIDNENPKTRAVDFDWTSYYTFDEINEWLDIQLATYPTILSNFVVGQSFQNRTIRGIRLAHNEVTIFSHVAKLKDELVRISHSFESLIDRTVNH